MCFYLLISKSVCVKKKYIEYVPGPPPNIFNWHPKVFVFLKKKYIEYVLGPPWYLKNFEKYLLWPPWYIKYILNLLTLFLISCWVFSCTEFISIERD